jgi:predicted permease
MALASFALELRRAARTAYHAPAFAATAILTLAIGIGVNTAMFNLTDALLLRPPAHIADPDRVVRLHFVRSSALLGSSTSERTNYPAVADAAESGAFASVAGYTTASVSVGRGPEAVEAYAMLATPGFFRVLGTQPERGAFPSGDLTSAASDQSLVLAHGFWKRHFGGDPAVIGKPLVIDGAPYVVAAIAPDGFTSLQPYPVDLWLPLEHGARTGSISGAWRTERESFWIDAVARVAPGTTAHGAAERASARLRHTRELSGGTEGVSAVTTAPIIEGRGADKPPHVQVSLWLAGLTTLVLLIACANVANLVVARNVARRREHAVRVSLGATRWQIKRQVIADIVALAVPGALAAVFVDFGLRNLIPAYVAYETPIPRGLIDPRAATLILATTVLAAFAVSTVALAQLRASALSLAPWRFGGDDGRAGIRTRQTLLAVQAGGSLALLFCAALFAKSLKRVESLDLGVDLDRTIQVSLNLDRGTTAVGNAATLYEEVAVRVRQHPAVEAVAISQEHPFMSGQAVGPWMAGRTQEDVWANRQPAYTTVVGAGFFSAVGAKSLVGRDFTEADRAGAQPVAIVNKPLAEFLWPDGDAIGQCVLYDGATHCAQIVGVLGGVWKFGALKRDKMVFYLPLAQTTEFHPGSILIRTRGDARRLMSEVRSLVQGVRPDLPAASISLAREIADPDFQRWRQGAMMFSLFGGVATAIAAIGLYGVVAYTTARRSRDIGIRMALGARWFHVLRVAAGEGLAAVAVGMILGAWGATVAGRAMEDLLFETSPAEPVLLVQTGLLLFAVAVAAIAVPLGRVLRVSPASVLRLE